MESTMKCTIYHRHGGFRHTPNNEKLQIEDDGSFSMWRSVGVASIPPSLIGRFEGKLETELNTRLWDLAEAVTATGDLRVVPPPDSVIEDIVLPGAHATLGIHQQAGVPWDSITGLLRPLLGELTKFPRAAIELEVRDDGRQALLVHRGNEPLRADLSKISIEAILWRNDAVESRWQGSLEEIRNQGIIQTVPGWSLDLPFHHGFDSTSDNRVVAYASFNAFDGEMFVPVSLQSG